MRPHSRPLLAVTALATAFGALLVGGTTPASAADAACAPLANAVKVEFSGTHVVPSDLDCTGSPAMEIGRGSTLEVQNNLTYPEIVNKGIVNVAPGKALTTSSLALVGDGGLPSYDGGALNIATGGALRALGPVYLAGGTLTNNGVLSGFGSDEIQALQVAAKTAADGSGGALSYDQALQQQVAGYLGGLLPGGIPTDVASLVLALAKAGAALVPAGTFPLDVPIQANVVTCRGASIPAGCPIGGLSPEGGSDIVVGRAGISLLLGDGFALSNAGTTALYNLGLKPTATLSGLANTGSVALVNATRLTTAGASSNDGVIGFDTNAELVNTGTFVNHGLINTGDNGSFTAAPGSTTILGGTLVGGGTVVAQPGADVTLAAGLNSGSVKLVGIVRFAVKTSSVPVAVVGKKYSAKLSTVGARGAVTWSIAGKLPKGLKFDAKKATISGKPSKTGKSTVVVTAQDATGVAVYAKLTVKSAYVAITTTQLKSVKVKRKYSVKLKALATSSVRWSVGGKLPKGVKLNAKTGALSGKPAKAGTYKLTFKVRDAKGRTASIKLPLIVTK